MKKALQIIFKSNGDMYDYADHWEARNGTNNIVEDAKDFKDRLKFTHMWGYRAGRAKFVSLNSGRVYYMFLADFEEAILAEKFINNVIEGEFKFVKKGIAQSVKLILPAKP